MRVVFLVSHLRSGGAERTVSYVSSAMADKGYNVTVLSLSEDIFYELNPKVEFKVIKQRKQGKGLKRYIVAFDRYLQVNKYIKQNKPDVVFCMLPDIAKHILKIHKKQGFALVTSERANPRFCKDEQTLHNRIKIFEQADGVIFQTERAKEFYSEAVQRKSVVIQNAVGNKLAYSVVAPEQKRNVISAVGRLDNQKDYPVMIDAFGKLCELYPDYKLEIYGEGPKKNELINYAKDKNLSENVFFAGAHSDALARIADSKCYVLSSIFEGMPNSLMEAMAIGMPCVSSDCPFGPAELIEDGVNGLLVPVGDSEKLFRAMKKMVEDTEFAARCGQNARNILKTNSTEKITDKYIQYVEQILLK